MPTDDDKRRKPSGGDIVSFLFAVDWLAAACGAIPAGLVVIVTTQMSQKTSHHMYQRVQPPVKHSIVRVDGIGGLTTVHDTTGLHTGHRPVAHGPAVVLSHPIHHVAHIQPLVRPHIPVHSLHPPDGRRNRNGRIQTDVCRHQQAQAVTAPSVGRIVEHQHHTLHQSCE